VYLLMSLSLFFMALTFSRSNRLEKNLRRTLALPFILTIVSLVAFLVQYCCPAHPAVCPETAPDDLTWLLRTEIRCGLRYAAFLIRGYIFSGYDGFSSRANSRRSIAGGAGI